MYNRTIRQRHSYDPCRRLIHNSNSRHKTETNIRTHTSLYRAYPTGILILCRTRPICTPRHARHRLMCICECKRALGHAPCLYSCCCLSPGAECEMFRIIGTLGIQYKLYKVRASSRRVRNETLSYREGGFELEVHIVRDTHQHPQQQHPQQQPPDRRIYYRVVLNVVRIDLLVF